MSYRTDPLAYWYRSKSGTELLCAPPKCGSSALAMRYFHAASVGDLQAGAIGRADRDQGGGPWRACDLAGVHKSLPRYLAIRDPVERFASLWRNKCRDQLTPHGNAAVHGMTPLQLADYIGRHPFADLHWFPVAAYYAPGVHLVELSAFLSRLGIEPGWNATRTLPDDPPMPVDAIAELYPADFNLWMRTR